MGKSQRTKGHGFERTLAKRFKTIFPNAVRKLEYQASDCDGTDLKNTGRIRVQAKAHKKYVSMNTIKEIKSDGIHLLVSKQDYTRGYLCAMYFEDFIDILKNIKLLEKNMMEINKEYEPLFEGIYYDGLQKEKKEENKKEEN